MIELGKFNTLSVCRIDGGVFVDGGELGEIPLQDVGQSQYQLGETLAVFVFIDGRHQALAYQQTPKAQVSEVAWLQVTSVGRAGAFLDWGLPKDLLVPFNEQDERMQEGEFYLVYLFLDESNRMVASAHLNDFLLEQAFYFKAGQAVDLLIADSTDLGVKAVVNHKYWGLLYKNEIFQTLAKGQRLSGFVKTLREDHKLDLCLSQDKYPSKIDDASDKVLSALQKHGGFLALTDHSDPEIIYDTFGVSKKVFKQAIGGLYKQRKIVIADDGIRLP